MQVARKRVPTIPDDKIRYFEEQLYNELSHMFEWTNLPLTIPKDYLERNLIRSGQVLFYEHPQIGLDVLVASATGYNRHNMPTHAKTIISSTENIDFNVQRRIKRLTDSDSAIEDFDRKKDGVLIYNKEQGKSSRPIVDHFARRLALTQIAFDTNLMWQNVPYLFQTDSDEMRLSIEKMFSDIFDGLPFIIVDKQLLAKNQDRLGVPSGIDYKGKELMDTRNELMMKFRETVGIDTAGVDKAERLITSEVESNMQHTKTVLQIMLEQRQIACENINAFFGTNISVDVVGKEHLGSGDQKEGEDVGTGDSGAKEFTED